MTSKTEKEIVLEYALRDEKNLRIALLAGSAYNDLRNKIISTFGEALEKELENRLGDGWRIHSNSLRDEPLAKFTGFWITREAWSDLYHIGLEAQRQGPNGFVIGVSKKVDAEHIGDLKEKLDEKCMCGKFNNYWVWWRYVDDKYKDWDREDVLLELWFRKETVVEYFAGELLKIKGLAAPLIDQKLDLGS